VGGGCYFVEPAWFIKPIRTSPNRPPRAPLQSLGKLRLAGLRWSIGITIALTSALDDDDPYWGGPAHRHPSIIWWNAPQGESLTSKRKKTPEGTARGAECVRERQALGRRTEEKKPWPSCASLPIFVDNGSDARPPRKCPVV
jgi:hypothetical protein